VSGDATLDRHHCHHPYRFPAGGAETRLIVQFRTAAITEHPCSPVKHIRVASRRCSAPQLSVDSAAGRLYIGNQVVTD
jgi:hypothetical protein